MNLIEESRGGAAVTLGVRAEDIIVQALARRRRGETAACSSSSRWAARRW